MKHRPGPHWIAFSTDMGFARRELCRPSKVELYDAIDEQVRIYQSVGLESTVTRNSPIACVTEEFCTEQD